jgi:hypothetical protein
MSDSEVRTPYNSSLLVDEHYARFVVFLFLSQRQKSALS